MQAACQERGSFVPWALIDQQELDRHIEENENEIARLQVQSTEESQIKEMMELSITMFTEFCNE